MTPTPTCFRVEAKLDEMKRRIVAALPAAIGLQTLVILGAVPAPAPIRLLQLQPRRSTTTRRLISPL
ncbi:MAG: hypothetical protein C3F11_06340 [Methylocystaceae bacterium]|nr:MAG: hypothetical protein C3F11_06340 [Methylocystaceae bacterium]